jgi:hypothetical protein
LRQPKYLDLDQPPREPGDRPRRSTTFRLSIVVPVLAVVAATVAFAIFSSSSPPAVAAGAQAGAAAPADADPNPDCTIVVPANPLSAKGLATPYQLTATDPANGACTEANVGQSAFVEATIVDPKTGALSVYRPLVLDMGATPAAPNVVPKLPANAVVGLWFGFNGDNLTLKSQGNSLQAGNCSNGVKNSIFGQFAFCNAAKFFTSANASVKKGQIKIPKLGTALDGLPCMTTRDYGLIDQDQSDNVISAYLVQPDGSVAQDTDANTKQLKDSTTLVNGSDNLLLDSFVDPALGCSTFTAPDLTNGGKPVSSLGLNELFAAARQAKPIALIPQIDPMVLVDDRINPAKTNLYRTGVNMGPFNKKTESAATYCQDTLNLGAKRIQQDKNFFLAAPSPDTGAANNLYTFMAQRWSASLDNLGCAKIINVGKQPVKLTTDADGVVTDAVFAKKTAPIAKHGKPKGNNDSTAANHAPHRPRKY